MRQAQTGATYLTRGSTYQNAPNLPPEFIRAIRERYEGTRLGRQELHAEVFIDLLGALWTTDMLEQARFKGELPEMQRIVVGVDFGAFYRVMRYEERGLGRRVFSGGRVKHPISLRRQ
jgi:phage terminase large subunit-like protein